MKNTDAVDVVMGWWLGLQEDRAARAQLRRCATLMDALDILQTHQLLKRIENRNLHDPAITLAIILAHVDKNKDGGPSFANALGKDNGQKLLSNLRFGSLLQALVKREEDWSAVIRNLRRAIKIAKGQNFNVRRLVGDILFFNEQSQRDWTYDYWQTASDEDNAAAPAQKSEPTIA
jgi:CRISPR system Cascade subunit CasB